MEYYSSIKMNEIMPFVATWMDLEIVILSEVKSDRERQISCVYVASKKKTTNELTYKTEIEFQTGLLTLLFHFHQEALQFLFAFCHKGGVICISKVIDISPAHLDSNLCFLQPSISHDVLCIC